MSIVMIWKILSKMTYFMFLESEQRDLEVMGASCDTFGDNLMFTIVLCSLNGYYWPQM